jgi:hypothetical protein
VYGGMQMSKSLELINENLNIAKAIQREGIDCYEEIKELEIIKQDLEVLEIIRKKDVNLATLKLCIIRTDTIEQLLSKYNKSRYFTQDELTMEELLKLKQWLEENKDENI